MCTNYLAIENEEGTIRLSCLVDDKMGLKKDCVILYFVNVEYENCWDSKIYLQSLFSSISSGEKEKSAKVKRTELKSFCKDNSLNYTEVKHDLIDIFKTAKKFGLFE